MYTFSLSIYFGDEIEVISFSPFSPSKYSSPIYHYIWFQFAESSETEFECHVLSLESKFKP